MNFIEARQENYKASDKNKCSRNIPSIPKVAPRIICSNRICSNRSRDLFRAGTPTYLGRWILDYLEENPRSFVKDIREALSRKANSDISKWYSQQVDLANKGKGSKNVSFWLKYGIPSEAKIRRELTRTHETRTPAYVRGRQHYIYEKISDKVVSDETGRWSLNRNNIADRLDVSNESLFTRTRTFVSSKT